MRTCVGCRVKKPAAELVRYVLDANGTIQRGRLLPGRGAWLCDTSECRSSACARSGFSRSFRTRLSREVVPLGIEAEDTEGSGRGSRSQ